MSLPKEKKNFITKIQAWYQEKFGGSGDPECEDAVDVAAYFTKMFGDQPDVFKQMLESVLTRVRAMDPSWDRPTCTQIVPEAPTQGKTEELWLPVWKLGFTNAHAVKGKSRSSQIQDCITNFLERPYSSSTDPLDVLMPRGIAVGATIPDFSVRHSIGFAKSLTCRLLLFATVDMRWKDSDIRLFLPELQALFSIKAVYSPGINARDQIQKSIGGKFMAAERTRPDIVQITHSLRDRALDEGVDFTQGLPKFIEEFQEDTMAAGRKFSDLEINALHTVPLCTDETLQKLDYHWQIYSMEVSGMPLSYVAHDSLREGTKIPASRVLDPQATALWTNILKPSPQKREAAVFRRIGKYVHAIKEAARLKRKINLRNNSQEMRCKLSHEDAYEVAALFTHWTSAWRTMLSPDAWNKAVMKFKRGGLDTELLEKCNSKVLHSPTDFRFLQALGCQLAKAVVVDTLTLELQQAEAVKARETATLTEISLLVAGEQNKWSKYQEATRRYKCESEAQRSAFKSIQNDRNAKLVGSEIEIRFPSREIDDSNHLQTFYQSSIEAYAMAKNVDHETMFQVWLINLMVPGFHFNYSALIAIAKACDMIATFPERTCAIILLPNTGTYGGTYDKVSMRKSESDIQGLLEDPDFKILWTRLTIAWDESTMAPQSGRPGQIHGFMLISDKYKDDDKTLKSLFAQSKLWIREGLGQVPCLALKHCVNPLIEMPKGHWDPEKDLGKAQRRKQWMAGHKAWETLRKKLWSGVPVTSAQHCAWIETHPYDNTLTECIIRSAFQGDAARAKQPTEMTIAAVWADMDTTLPNYSTTLANFIKKAGVRMLKNALREKIYFLDGWKEEEFSQHTGPPTYDEKSFVATFPSASAHLPFRQEWLTLQEGKFQDATVLSAFKSMVDDHDVKYNPSKVPYAGEESRKRKAADDQKKPTADEIPHVEGDPTTKDDFLTKNKNTLVIQSLGQEFLFTTKGEMWCWGLVDDVVPDDEPIALVFGHFALNDEGEAEIQAKRGWKVAFTDPQTRVQCSTEVTAMKSKCPEKLTDLASILAALDEPQLECHEYETKYEKNDEGAVISRTFVLKVTKTCAFTPAKTPKDYNEEWENAGSRLVVGTGAKEWDHTTLMHKKGHVQIRHRLMYQDGNQFQGMNPTKPGIFAQKPVMVKKDTLRRWA